MSQDNPSDTPKEGQKKKPTPEQIADYKNRIELSQGLLQTMATAADNGDISGYFRSYFHLMSVWTDKATAAKNMVIPPWYIPDAQLQLVIIHTQLALLTKALNDSGVFQAAEMAQKEKNASGLVDANGRKIV